MLHEASQTALRVGKRVHSETGIDRAGASVVSVALQQAAESSVGGDAELAGKRIVILGAGSMGALAGATLQRLAGGGDLDVVVINRSLDRAERLAGILGGRAGRAGHAGRRDRRGRRADLLHRGHRPGGRGRRRAARAGRPLVVLDLALPRDVDPAVSLMADVHYVDLEVLRSSGAMVSDAEVEAAATIVAAELRGYLTRQQALAVAPTVTALRARAAQVVDAELLRLDSRLPGLDPAVRAELASAVRRAVDKVLHAPTVRVKELAATPEGNSYAAALRELFDLDPNRPGSVTAVSRADSATPSAGRPRADGGGVMLTTRTIRVGTRASLLARTQTQLVVDAFAGATRTSRSRPCWCSTEGDRSAAPLEQIGGTGVFVSALREALLAGEIDVAVHSFKDLPTAPAAGIALAAVPRREDPRDALCARDGLTLLELPPGARVGTGSPRRAAQLRALDLGLEIVPIRGNVDTRLARVGSRRRPAGRGGARGGRPAAARPGRADHRTARPDPGAAGRRPGRAGDRVPGVRRPDARALLAPLDDHATRAAVAAERSLLAALEAGCTAPVGALAEVTEGDDGVLEVFLRGSVTAIDGSDAVRLSATGPLNTAEQVGRRLAAELIDLGANMMMGSSK